MVWGLEPPHGATGCTQDAFSSIDTSARAALRGKHLPLVLVLVSRPLLILAWHAGAVNLQGSCGVSGQNVAGEGWASPIVLAAPMPGAQTCSRAFACAAPCACSSSLSS